MPAKIRHQLHCVVLSAVIGSVLLLHPANTAAQSWVAYTASVRAQGMGGAGSVIDDPWAGTRNPGALAAAMGAGQFVAFRNDNELSLKRLHSNTLIGIASPSLRIGSGPAAPRVIAAFAHRSQKAGIRDVELTDGSTEDYIDEMDYSTFSLGIDYYIQIGAGVTAIHAYNAVSEEPTAARDYGLFVRIPVLRLLTDPQQTRTGPKSGSLSPSISVAAGYTWSSRNNGPEGDSPFHDPLANYNLFGLSVDGGLDYRDLNVARVVYARDETDTKSYFSNVSWGFEFSILDAFALRFGEQGSSDNSTHGYSVHARGLAQWLYVLSLHGNYDRLPWYTTVFEIQYQYAKTEHSIGQDSSYDEIGFMLDARPLFAR